MEGKATHEQEREETESDTTLVTSQIAVNCQTVLP